MNTGVREIPGLNIRECVYDSTEERSVEINRAGERSTDENHGADPGLRWIRGRPYEFSI